MNRLRTRLIAVFVLATLLPLGLTLWTTLQLVERSLDLAPLRELEAVTASLQETGRQLYQQSSEALRADALAKRIEARAADPEEARKFLERGVDEGFERAGDNGNRLDYFVRRGDQVVVYSRDMGIPHGTADGRDCRGSAGARQARVV